MQNPMGVGLGSSVVKCLLSMSEVLGSIPRAGEIIQNPGTKCRDSMGQMATP